MEKEGPQQSPSRQTASKSIYAAFEVLKAAGGHLPGREVINKVRENISFTDWEKQILEKTGYVRWESILHFFTVDCTKAGYLRKNKGVWYLTEEGDKAMALGPTKLLDSATKGYRQWVAENKQTKIENSSNQSSPIESEENAKQEQKATLVGLFVTSGYFTSESERSARDSHRHIRLIDIDTFIALWQEFYPFMKDEDKNMLPLQSIYFLGSNE